MTKYLETKMKLMTRLFAALLALTVGTGASAQTMGSTLESFNVLASPAVTLTGTGALPLVVNRVGISPGNTLTTTDASATFAHLNDATAVNGQAEALVYWNSLTAAVGANPDIVLATNTLPPNLPAIGALGAGVTLITAAADVTDTGSVTITGVPGSIVIFQVGSFLSFTNMDVLLAGGILPRNVHWQVTTAVTITNNDAGTRSVPGTFVNNTAAQDVAITVADGNLTVGRFVSLQGEVTITKSGGVLAVDNPASAEPGVGAAACSDGLFYPSPATGAVGTFSYCMASAGEVKIRVYNAIGDLAVKVDDNKPAGQQTSTINTARLAPGVYLYILERSYDNGDKSRSKVKKFVVKH